MEIETLKIPEVKVLKVQKYFDQRGYFAETYNKNYLQSFGIEFNGIQDNQSLSLEKGTLRGLHFQSPPYVQKKIVRCIKGSILDVAVDFRLGSKSFGKHIKRVLSEDNFEQIFIPDGFAHGFLTLEQNTVVSYKVDNYYSAACDGGILWNDEKLDIDWGMKSEEIIVSDKDTFLLKMNEQESPFKNE